MRIRGVSEAVKIKRSILFFLVAVLSMSLMAGCASTQEQNSDGGQEQNQSSTKNEGYSFDDNVFSTPEYKIEITEYKVIPVGAVGNEYGHKPVIAFWYKVTNLTDKDINATTTWASAFSAIQDNNANTVNTLSIGMLPDDRFLDSQLQTIKKDGTVENAVAYILDDMETPVKLQAKKGFTNVVGEQTYTIQ